MCARIAQVTVTQKCVLKENTDMKRQVTDTEIQLMIDNVSNMRLASIVKAINILRPQKDILPTIEQKLLATLENELKSRK